MTKVNDEGMQNTSDLDQGLKDGQITFAGEPPEDVAAPVITGTPDPDKKGDEGEEKGKEKPEDEKTAGEETPEEIAVRTQKEDISPESDFRFKTHSEAEKGYKELQGRTTKAEQRAKAVEEELNRVKNAERIKAEAAATRATIIDYAATRRAKALEEIDALDPDDADYRKKAATCLSQADIDIYEHYQTHGRSEAPSPTAVDTTAGDEPPAADAENVTKYVQEKIIAEGFEATDPLFWQYAGHAPITDEKGRPITLDAQIQWAVSQTKQYHENIRTKLKAEDEIRVAEEVRKKQAADLPLGRGTSAGAKGADKGPAAAQEDKPVSLSDAVEFAQDRRRL
jgi:hypothetical protein